MRRGPDVASFNLRRVFGGAMAEPFFSLRLNRGHCELQLRGRLEPSEVPALADAICEAARAQEVDRVEVSFAHCAGELDLAIPSLLQELRRREDAPGVELTGLTQHHVRLLGYLGFEEAGESPGT